MSRPESVWPAPVALSRLLGRLPQLPLSLALCAGLEVARRAGPLQQDLSFMEGRSVCIAVPDLGLRVTLAYRDGHFRPQRDDAGAHVRFSASAADYLALLARREDPDTLFFQRRLRIEGDTELGLALKNVLDATEWPLASWLR